MKKLIKFVPASKAKERYKICKCCEFLTKLKFCSQCHCFMPLKTKLDGVNCPIWKWGSANNNWGG